MRESPEPVLGPGRHDFMARLMWTAGFLEGEGCFSNANDYGVARISVAQVQLIPLTWLQSWWGGTSRQDTKKLMPSQRNLPWRWAVYGIQAAGLMMTLYPLLSPKRQEQVRTVLIKWRRRQSHPRYRMACPSSHPYDIFRNGKRYCRKCRNTTERRRYQRRRSDRLQERLAL
jgi:hypothetical protein